MGYEASEHKGNLWVLGVKRNFNKSAADTLTVFKDILNDIDKSSKVANNEKSKLILQHISATMSNSAATEVKFNSLLEDYRKSLIPVIVENYDHLSENEQFFYPD